MSDRQYPVLVTRDLVIFPSNSMPLTVASKRNRLAIDDAVESDGLILVVPVATDIKTGDANPEDLHAHGTLCKVEISKKSRRKYQVILNSVYRACLVQPNHAAEDKSLIYASYDEIPNIIDIDSETIGKLLTSGKSIAIEILKMAQGNGASKLTEVVEKVDHRG